MEANLKALDKQERKYAAELDTALAEYAELKKQGEQFDPVELYEARQVLRPDAEQKVIKLVQEKYGDKYNGGTMVESKWDVARHLNEYAESQEIRQIKREQEYLRRQQNRLQPKKKHRDEWER